MLKKTFSAFQIQLTSSFSFLIIFHADDVGWEFDLNASGVEVL